MAIIPVQQPLTDIVFAKATEANLAIANTPTGAGTLEDVIAPVTKAQGTITTATPITTAGTATCSSGSNSVSGSGTTFEDDGFAAGMYLFFQDATNTYILAGIIDEVTDNVTITLTTDVLVPFSGATVVAAPVGTSVLGQGTNFQNDFKAGEYLFYYDLYTSQPILLGKISQVNSATSMTLTANASAALIAPHPCGMASVVLSSQESILMRIGIAPISGGIFFLPNWNQWLSPNLYGSPNNANTNNLKQISAANSPSTPIVPQTNVQYSITPVFGWEINPTTQKYFPAEQDVPSYVYAQLTSYSGAALAPNTLFRLFASASFEANCIKASLNYSKNDLVQAGYFAN